MMHLQQFMRGSMLGAVRYTSSSSKIPRNINQLKAMFPSKLNKQMGKMPDFMFSDHVSNVQKAPSPTKLYMGISLVPYVYPVIHNVLTLSSCPILLHMQTFYAGCLLVYFGGISVGRMLDGKTEASIVQVGYSVLPLCLVYFAIKQPPVFSCVLMISGMAGFTYMDLVSDKTEDWFKSFRVLSCAIGAVCMTIALLFNFILPLPQKKACAGS